MTPAVGRPAAAAAAAASQEEAARGPPARARRAAAPRPRPRRGGGGRSRRPEQRRYGGHRAGGDGLVLPREGQELVGGPVVVEGGDLVVPREQLQRRVGVDVPAELRVLRDGVPALVLALDLAEGD